MKPPTFRARKETLSRDRLTPPIAAAAVFVVALEVSILVAEAAALLRASTPPQRRATLKATENKLPRWPRAAEAAVITIGLVTSAVAADPANLAMEAKANMTARVTEMVAEAVAVDIEADSEAAEAAVDLEAVIAEAEAAEVINAASEDVVEAEASVEDAEDSVAEEVEPK